MVLPNYLAFILKYPERYAVLVNDSGERFVALIITRSNSGDIYVNWPHRPDSLAHTSYHQSGVLHHKSFGRKIFPRVKQRPELLTGSEPIVSTSVKSGDAKSIGILYSASDFADFVEIPESILDPVYGTTIVINAVENGHEDEPHEQIKNKIFQQKTFGKKTPQIYIYFYTSKP